MGKLKLPCVLAITKRPLDFSNGLVYNLLRKVIGIDFPIALSGIIYEIAFTLGGGMLFLFVKMIVYVRQSRKYY